MPTSEELRKSLGIPEVARLKALGEGIRIGEVIGPRVLVKKVKPWTEADRLEKEGLLYVPEDAKEKNTPLESTGIVVAMGSTALRDPMNLKLDPGDPERNVDCFEYPIITEGTMVAFSKYAGSDISADHEDFRILELREILCTLVDTKGVVTPVKDER